MRPVENPHCAGVAGDDWWDECASGGSSARRIGGTDARGAESTGRIRRRRSRSRRRVAPPNLQTRRESHTLTSESLVTHLSSAVNRQ